MNALTAAALALLLISSIAILSQRHIPRAGREELRKQTSRLDFFRVGAHAGPRPLYPYSVLPGGAYDGAELRKKVSSDAIAARHYQQIRLDLLRRVEAVSRLVVYVSYRKEDSIYWTRKPIQIPKGETLLTDGALFVRARCGNRISTVPQNPVSEAEPPKESLDMPEYWQSAPFSADQELPWQKKSRLSAMLDPDITGNAPYGLGTLPVGSALPLTLRTGSNGAGGTGASGSGSGGNGGNGGSGMPGSSGSGSSGGSGGGTHGSTGAGGTGGGGNGTPGSPGSDGPGGGGHGTSGGPGPGGPGGGGSGTPGSPGPGGPGGGGHGNPGDPGGDPPGDPKGRQPKPGDDVPVAPIPEPGSIALLLTAVTAAAGIRLWNSRRGGRTRR